MAERFRAAHPKTRLILYPDSQHVFVVPGYKAACDHCSDELRRSALWSAKTSSELERAGR